MSSSSSLDSAVIKAQMRVVNECIGAWRFQVINSCHRLGIVKLLAEGPRTAADLALAAGLPPESLTRLLDAGVAVELLQKTHKVYTNAPLATHCLLPDSPGYLGNWVNLMAGWYDVFGKLTEAVRGNAPVVDLNAEAPPEAVRDFIKGMVDYASYRGRDLLRHIDLAGRRRLLDVGGGPAIYSIMFCKEYPEIRCTNMDLPAAIEVARDYVGSAGLEDRIDLRPGDYRTDPLGEGHDVAFLSHVLHQEPPDTGRQILHRVFDSLEPGGLVIIQAMFPDESRTRPVFPVLHDLLCLLVFPGGVNHSVKDIRQWLEEAGFVDIEHRGLAVFNVNSLVVATRP